MSAPSERNDDPAGAARSNGGTSAGAADQGVLSQLPRTRPQRPSARRDASRRAGQAGGKAPAADGTAAPKPKKAKAASASAKRAPAKPRVTAARAHVPRGSETAVPDTAAPRARPRRTQVEPIPVPKQGFESESDRARGPVRPPGGTELLTSAAEIVGELTKAGFSTGERLLRALLPRS